MARVLVVDDSATMRHILCEILSQDPEIQVVGQAEDGASAVRMAQALRPDVITMDIFMPQMNGYEAARQIMATNPVPIVVVSSGADVPELQVAFHALQAGALDVLPKPSLAAFAPDGAGNQRLIRAVKLLADVRVTKKRFPENPSASSRRLTEPTQKRTPPKVVGIASSTGGPTALNQIFSALPASFPLPVVAVQHIADGFLPGLIQWLQTSSSLPIGIAQDGARPLAGRIYFAASGQHLCLGPDGKFATSLAAPVNHVRPSASVFFDSICQHWRGTAIGVILTGMGADGALALKKLRDLGGTVIAQDEETSVVYGMPRAAVEAGAVEHQRPISEIGPLLVRLTERWVVPISRGQG